MTIVESIFLGAIQGVTEFLPVSSDGHLQIGSALLGLTDPSQNLGFAVLVHVATVLASLVVFRKEVVWLVKGLIQFKWNEETQYAAKLIFSAIPVIIVGLFFIHEVEKLFGANMTLTGGMLMATACLLMLTAAVPSGHKEVGWFEAAVMGLAQAAAVLPGLSRSGSTIASALVMRVDKEKATRFSFLMVILPILGKAAMDLKDLLFPEEGVSMAPAVTANLGTGPMVVAFLTAFLVGIAACSLLVAVVRRGKIHWFGFYCLLAGIICVLAGQGLI